MKVQVNKDKGRILEKIFTAIAILYLILLVYSVKEIPVGTLVLLFLCEMLCLKAWKQNIAFRVMRPLEPIIIMMMGQLIYMFIMGKNILQMGQYVFYLLIAFVFLPTFFDRKFGLYIYRIAVILSSVFGIIQFVGLKLFNYYIPGMLPLSELYNAIKQSNSVLMNMGASVRPRSFFSEPSVYGMFAGIFLIELLVAQKKLSVKNICLALLVSLGQVCVSSSTGILLMFVAWAGYVVKNILNNKYNRVTLTLMLLIFAGGVFFLFTDVFQMFAQRTFNLQLEGGGGTLGRISGYFLAFDTANYSILQFIFGHSFLSADTFLPGWASIMWYFGVVGIFAYILMLYYLHKNASSKEQKCMVYILVLMAFFLTSFYSINELFFFAVYFAYGAKGECIGDENKEFLY